MSKNKPSQKPQKPRGVPTGNPGTYSDKGRPTTQKPTSPPPRKNEK